jgi:hypothetical protein
MRRNGLSNVHLCRKRGTNIQKCRSLKAFGLESFWILVSTKATMCDDGKAGGGWLELSNVGPDIFADSDTSTMVKLDGSGDLLNNKRTAC